MSVPSAPGQLSRDTKVSVIVLEFSLVQIQQTQFLKPFSILTATFGQPSIYKSPSLKTIPLSSFVHSSADGFTPHLKKNKLNCHKSLVIGGWSVKA